MAEALLYQHVVITNDRTSCLWLLHRSLSAKRHPNGVSVGTRTKKITISALSSRESGRDAAYHNILRDIILLCPNLESFCIYGRPRDAYVYPETTEDIYKALPDHLRMCAWANLGETVQLGHFQDSCSFFSRLEHLQLRRTWGYANEEVILTLPRLRSLSFASWIANYPMAQWDLPSLVWLEISVESAIWLEELEPFFLEHGKNLQFLQLVPGDLDGEDGFHYLYSIEIPLNFFRYFPLLSCLSVDHSWMQLGVSDDTPASSHMNLTTLNLLRPDPRHGPHQSCGEFVHSFFVVHQGLFPGLKDVIFTLNGGYVVVPVSHPWFLSGVRPTREPLTQLGDGFSVDLVDQTYF